MVRPQLHQAFGGPAAIGRLLETGGPAAGASAAGAAIASTTVHVSEGGVCTYDVKYIMGGREKGLDQSYVQVSNIIGAYTARRESAIQGEADRKRIEKTHGEGERYNLTLRPSCQCCQCRRGSVESHLGSGFV